MATSQRPLIYRHPHGCWYRALEFVSKLFCNCRFLPIGDLSAQSVIKDAEKKAGSKLSERPVAPADEVLDPKEARYQARMVKHKDAIAVLFKDIDEEQKNLTCLGRVFLRAWFVRCISNRIMIMDYIHANYKALQEQKIVRPVFVLGAPRTGTSLTLNLLASDPNHRSLLLWQGLSPLLPEKQAKAQTAMRIKAITAFMPHLQAVHEFGLNESEEDMVLMDYTLINFFNNVLFNAPNYAQWLYSEDLDMTGVFRFHQFCLQILQHRYPSGKQWVLKAPVHLAYIETIFELYPDALMIWCHRDLNKVLPSTASLIQHTRSVFAPQVDNRQIGQFCLETLSFWLQRGEKARAKYPDRFFDQNYEDLIKDPIGSMKRCYAHFGTRLTPEAEASMNKLLQQKPRGKHGEHKYSLEQFGFNPDEIEKRYGGYIAKYLSPKSKSTTTEHLSAEGVESLTERGLETK